MKLFVCPLLNGCSNTINSGSVIRDIIFFSHFFLLHLIWPNICMPPPPFLPTIHRMYIYLQKVCYKPSLSLKYSYFAFSSINSRSEYGMYHFHGTFLFIYQMVFEQAWTFLGQTFGKQPFSAPKHWFINIKWYLWWHFYIVTS